MEASSCKSGGAFAIFLLKAIYDALCEIANTEQVIGQVTEQVERLLKVHKPMST